MFAHRNIVVKTGTTEVLGHLPKILIRTLVRQGSVEGGTFYISAPSLPCYAERKTYR